MKKEGHPPYQEILFVDSSTGFEFVCGSTLQPKEKQMYQGKEYPVYRVSVSSASHPFFTKSKQFIDSEGRVDKFMKKYKKPAAQQQSSGTAPAPQEKKADSEAKPAAKKATETKQEKPAKKAAKKTKS